MQRSGRSDKAPPRQAAANISSAERARRLCLEALGFWNRGGAAADPEQAMALLNQAIELDPLNSSYYSLKSSWMVYLEEDSAEALECSKRACELNPCATNWMYRAQILRNAKRLPAALQAINEAQKLRAKDPQIFFDKAQLLVEAKDLPAAERALTQSIALNSTVESRMSRARIRLQLKLYSGCIEDVDWVLKCGHFSKIKDRPDAYVLRAKSMAKLDRRAEATGEFLAAMKAFPTARLVQQEALSYFRQIGDLEHTRVAETNLKRFDEDVYMWK